MPWYLLLILLGTWPLLLWNSNLIEYDEKEWLIKKLYFHFTNINRFFKVRFLGHN